MFITRTVLKPLQRMKQLKGLRANNWVYCCHEKNTFTLTFQLDNEDAEEILQDLVITFEKKRTPRVYISEPYKVNNSEVTEL